MRTEGAAPIFASRHVKIWLLILGCVLYFAFCWVIFTVAVAQAYGWMEAPIIAADSGAYFEAAGLADTSRGGNYSNDLVSFGGSTLGPVLIALVGRTEFGVACVNCALFLLILWWAGMVPGVRREYFAILMVLEPQLLPTLMTLNKEILALAGLVSFAAYMYSRQRGGRRWASMLLLFAGLFLSLLSRWVQVLIPLWYLAAESRFSPLRGKPRRSVVVLLLFTSVAWVLAVSVLHLNLGGFIVAVEGTGTAARLYAIQEKGGYFLVALPKIIMEIAGRWVTPGYFLNDYWHEDFGMSWQNQYIGILHSVAMLVMLGVMILKNRFRLSRPLVYLAMIYFVCTALNPFIQPRYMYPAYALLALEMSRTKGSLEPAPMIGKLPALPPSYRKLQAETASCAD